MSNILVTGSAGFIGSHVVDLLLENGHDVFGIDNHTTNKHLNENVTFRAGEFVHWWLLEDSDIEVIVHLAAQPSLINSTLHPVNDFKINAFDTLQFLKWAKNNGVKKFVFASTSAVYPSDYSGTIDENDPLLKTDFSGHFYQPSSPYGLSKLTAEMYIRYFFPDNHIILRLGNVYGPRQVPIGENQIVANAMQHIYKQTPWKFHPPALQTRDYVYVQDVAQAFIRAATRPTHGTFNISSGEPTVIKDLVDKIKETSEWEGDWEIGDEMIDSRGDIQLDVSAADLALMWQVETSLEDGLRKTHEWWREHAREG